MASRQCGMKKFGPRQCDSLYKKAYRIRCNWEEILHPSLNTYLQLCKVTYNCPPELAMGALLPFTAVVCGPNTMVHGVNYAMPLNRFSVAVCAPGGGKSAAFKHFICDCTEQIFRDHGTQLLLETYSSAGLHHHHADNKNYAIVSSDEGHQILANISCKEGRNEAERALLNKLWNAKGDKTSLKDGDRGFSSTSMSLFVQPHPLLNELASLGLECDRFYDRFLFFVDKPKLHVAAEQREATTSMEAECGSDFMRNVFSSMFSIHHDSTYVFAEQAQTMLDSLIDEHALDFNSQYNSNSGEFKCFQRFSTSIQMRCHNKFNIFSLMFVIVSQDGKKKLNYIYII